MRPLDAAAGPGTAPGRSAESYSRLLYFSILGDVLGAGPGRRCFGGVARALVTALVLLTAPSGGAHGLRADSCVLLAMQGEAAVWACVLMILPTAIAVPITAEGTVMGIRAQARLSPPRCHGAVSGLRQPGE
ncbi:hypothetical protein ACFTXJ_00975 [Streptomyces zhihengii]|uniref:hypothetical protein n=1 Tax=Streptomyces zhihengii TaxID=1818004 RepID=UPI00363DC145